MISLRGKYDLQITEIQRRMDDLKRKEKKEEDLSTRIQEMLMALLEGREENKVFLRHILRDMIVFREGRVELRLLRLPSVFHFQIQRNGAKQ